VGIEDGDVEGCDVGVAHVALSLSSVILVYVELVVSNPVPLLFRIWVRKISLIYMIQVARQKEGKKEKNDIRICQ
jgi:hypothetical protein